MMSSSFIDSLIEINAYLVSLSILWFVIRHKISFLSQRLLLLVIPIISLLIWYFKSQLSQSGLVLSVIPLEPFLVQNTVAETISNPFSFTVKMAYSLGVVVFLAVFVVKIIRVLFFFKNAPTNGHLKLNTTSLEDSFSFFNFIHIRADLNEEERQVVLEHELIHYQKHHSFDLMLFEIYHSLLWFNPLLFLMKKELINIHEFEVDQEMYASHKTNYMRHLLNYALGSNDSHYLLTSPFYSKLTLKKRIETMKNSNKSNNVFLLLSLPILAITFMVISCESKDLESPTPDYVKTTEARAKAGVVMDVSELSKQTAFPGGTEKMYTFLVENIKYPESAINDSIEGRVFVNFVITENGEVTEAKVIRGVNEALDAEALRVINLMPHWTPAEKDGKTVAVQFNLPISFKLK